MPKRLGSGVLAAARGRRMLVFDIDGVVSALYRFGGRFLFTKAAAIVMSVFAVAGMGLFLATWWRGSQAIFLANGSYLLGAIVLLLLNLLALASHELGHALATKHAGREVPAVGVLVFFGIPSVFVDTTDVWMAGRRARILVTAAGPFTGLVLAGSIQLVGLAVPALGPLAFKLAFAWYVNALFNLNPLLALDGYYLLMDWLEIPNLRGRGLAWVTSRLRGRPPSWSGLDREGRIVALYGVLAVLWLAVAVNLVYRIWADRVAGLATGLWHSGLAGQALLVLIVLGLCAPLIYIAAGRVARWWRSARARASEKQREADAPRRMAALRASDLGGLPEHALAGLAARARWLRPRSGTQLILAGAAQQAVYVVVDGAMQARKPGDPGGVIRHHVGAGGVVGLANALTGRSTSLDWHTAGTTLLAVPAATVATVVGPLPGPPPADRAEAEALFTDTPALSGLARRRAARADRLRAPGRPRARRAGRTARADARRRGRVRRHRDARRGRTAPRHARRPGRRRQPRHGRAGPHARTAVGHPRRLRPAAAGRLVGAPGRRAGGERAGRVRCALARRLSAPRRAARSAGRL
nr:hypothetical protein GCM10020092_014240 [Actinoplanes digitatis]